MDNYAGVPRIQRMNEINEREHIEGLNRLIVSGPKGWFKLIGFWSVPIIIASSVTLLQQMVSADQTVTFKLFLMQNWVWYYWAALCPITYRIAARYTLDGPVRTRSIVVHSVAGIVAALLVSILYGLLIAVMRDQPMLQGMISNTTGPFAVGRHVQNLVIYGLLVGSMTVIRTQRMRRSQEQEASKLAVRASQLEARLATAQLSFLRMQLHPHFLFNALNSIMSLVQQQRIDEASRTIDLLAGLLRAALDHSTSPFVPLKQEIDFLKRYMEIEKVRYPERFEPEFELNPECLKALVPALIMQPLVENAIGHALALNKDARMLKVIVVRRGDWLELEVHDNGPGFPADWNLDRDAGIGLSNVQERLRIHYGEPSELYIRKRESGAGSVVGIKIPFKAADPE